jgi:5-methylcytosine-specific restriction endonuclease McrA
MTEGAGLFVALEFPPWIRWGQRRGASVDHVALRVAFPDARHYERCGTEIRFGVECPKYRLAGGPWRCGWCGTACPGRRTSWCSDACAAKFYRVWSWGAVSAYVAHRDGYRCQRCPRVFNPELHYREYQCDHIVPVKDGGTDDPSNLRTLCPECHIAVGYEQRRARKTRTAPELALGL